MPEGNAYEEHIVPGMRKAVYAVILLATVPAFFVVRSGANLIKEGFQVDAAVAEALAGLNVDRAGFRETDDSLVVCMEHPAGMTDADYRGFAEQWFFNEVGYKKDFCWDGVEISSSTTTYDSRQVTCLRIN